MSSPIKSLIIPFTNINESPSTIADTFFINDIAIVKRVTRIPYLYGETTYYTVYVDIEEWLDSEASYNFIKSLKNPENKTTIYIIGMHEKEQVEVLINKHYNPEDNIYLYTFSTDFGKDYYYKQFYNVFEEEELAEFEDMLNEYHDKKILYDFYSEQTENNTEYESENTEMFVVSSDEEDFKELEDAIRMHLQECPGY